ncbi:unnamed protein product [Brachionus calyciflorus]|uniref:Uncharacterized protein n=1 Tax=Brachionus calyciflorus TaxID=104777 RepID=A0A813M3L1_9BILA|nr:unnamed protein product [Brachionus calyciflorus]
MQSQFYPDRQINQTNQATSINRPNTKPSYSKGASKESNGQNGGKNNFNKNKKNNTNNLDIVRKMLNSQPKIEYSNPKRHLDSDGYTLVKPRNIGFKSRHKVTGSAISGIKSPRSINRPYSYYVGQWCMNTTADILKKHSVNPRLYHHIGSGKKV